MIGAMLDGAKGHLSPTRLDEILSSPERGLQPRNEVQPASAAGLYLTQLNYPPDCKCKN